MNYLVDLGKLVPVAAANPRDAYSLAVLAEEDRHDVEAVVYRLDPEGEPIEGVFAWELIRLPNKT